MSPNGTFCSYKYYNESVCANYASLDLGTIELFKGYPDILLKFAVGFCILFMFIGIPGNIITIAALLRYKKVRNATAMFIINLSCSDLIFCSFNLPLAASSFWQRSWRHGHFVCRLIPFTVYTVIAVALLTILAISVNRYILIAYPRLYPKLYKPKNIGLMIASIWLFSMAVFIPTWLEKYGRFGLDPNTGLCSILPDENGQTTNKYFVAAAFTLPCVGIIFCYVRIIFIVRRTAKKSLPPKKLPEKYKESFVTYLPTFNAMQAPNCSSITDNEESSESSSEDTQINVTFNAKNRKTITNPSENGVKPLQRRRTVLKRAVARLKMSLPTRKDRRLSTMIFAIMTSFCVCHLPITITQLFVDASDAKNNATTCIVSYILMFSSSSIDPIIYVLMSREYRKAYRHLLKRRRKGTLTTN